MTSPAGGFHQLKAWTGQFGRDYTDRNPQDPRDMNELYLRQYGVSRHALNKEFIGDLNRDTYILEVGANVGSQLALLQEMGFESLYGVELQRYAVELSKRRTQNIDIIQGNVLDLPFKDQAFGLVMTSGLLIHISPADLPVALREIHRCTRSYIWGFEDFAEKAHEAVYRGQSNLLLRRNFARLFLDSFNDLSLVKEKKIRYGQGDAVDQMYLLVKHQPRIGPGRRKVDAA